MEFNIRKTKIKPCFNSYVLYVNNLFGRLNALYEDLLNHLKRMLGFKLYSKLLDIALLLGIFCALSLLTYYISKRYYVLKELAVGFTVCSILILSKAFYSCFKQRNVIGELSAISYWFLILLLLLRNTYVNTLIANISTHLQNPNWFDKLQKTAYFLLFSNCVFLILLPYSGLVLFLCLLSSISFIYFIARLVFDLQTLHLSVSNYMELFYDNWAKRSRFVKIAYIKAKMLNEFFFQFQTKFAHDENLAQLITVGQKIQELTKQMTEIESTMNSLMRKCREYNNKSEADAFRSLMSDQFEQIGMEKLLLYQFTALMPNKNDVERIDLRKSFNHHITLIKKQVYEKLLKSLIHKKEHFKMLCDSLLKIDPVVESDEYKGIKELVEEKEAHINSLCEIFEKSEDRVSNIQLHSAQEKSDNKETWENEDKQLKLYEEPLTYASGKDVLLYMDWIIYACFDFTEIDKAFFEFAEFYESITQQNLNFSKDRQL